MAIFASLFVGKKVYGRLQTVTIMW